MRRRGQILPILAAVIALFGIGFSFWFNVAMFNVSAIAAMDGALRSAGLAAIAERDLTVDNGLERWYVSGLQPVVSGTSGTIEARAVALAYLTGKTGGTNPSGNSGAEWLFTDDLAAVLANTSGTSSLSVDGLDVEILDPAYGTGQTRERFLNGELTSDPVTCGDPNSRGISSVLLGASPDNSCFTTTTVVLRLRLANRQMIGPDASIVRTAIMGVGTDALE